MTPVGVKTLHEFSVLRNDVEVSQYLSPAPAVVNEHMKCRCVTLAHNWAAYVVSLRYTHTPSLQAYTADVLANVTPTDADLSGSRSV